MGVLTASPRSGRLLVTYYLVLFVISAFIAGDVTLARGLVVGGGIAIAGLVLGECVAGLGQKLAVERAQRAQIEQLMLRVFPESVAAALETGSRRRGRVRRGIDPVRRHPGLHRDGEPAEPVRDRQRC